MIKAIFNWILNTWKHFFGKKALPEFEEVVQGTKEKKQIYSKIAPYDMTPEDWHRANPYLDSLEEGMTCVASRKKHSIPEYTIMKFRSDSEFFEIRAIALKKSQAVRTEKKQTKKPKVKKQKTVLQANRKTAAERKQKTDEKMVKALIMLLKDPSMPRKKAFKEYEVCYTTWSSGRTLEQREILQQKANELFEKSNTPPEPKVKKPRYRRALPVSGEVLPEELEKFNKIIDLVAKGTPVLKAMEIVDLTKTRFYFARTKIPSLIEKLEEAKRKGALIQEDLKKKDTNPSLEIFEAKTKAKEERKIHFQEYEAIMENPEATKQFVNRIEDALTDHLGGESLQNALIKNKVNLSKYLQLLRFDIHDLIETDIYAKDEYNKLKSNKNNNSQLGSQ